MGPQFPLRTACLFSYGKDLIFLNLYYASLLGVSASLLLLDCFFVSVLDSKDVTPLTEHSISYH